MEKRALIFLLGLFILITGATTTYAMTCSFEHVAMVGYPRRMMLSEGPATQAYGQVFQADWGPNGEIYFVSKLHPGVFVIDNGVISRVAGMERRGYRNGPAEFAMFDNAAHGYHENDIAVDFLGNIYVTDGYNNVVRKVYKDSNDEWMVTTFAGGGTITPTVGQTVPATSLYIGGPLAIAYGKDGNIWIQPSKYFIKIDPITSQATVVSDDFFSYNSYGAEAGYNSRVMMCDSTGTFWGLENHAGDLWKYSEANGFEALITGNRDQGTYDGPIENASLVTCSHVTTTDGSEVYLGGADEAGNLRRVKDEGDGLWIKSLMPDDTWQVITPWGLRSQGKNSGSPVFMDNDGAIYLTNSQYTTDTTKFRKMTCIP